MKFGKVIKKASYITICLMMLMSNFFVIPLKVNAEDVYYVTKEDVNLRSEAKVANGNIIMSIKRGSVVNLLSTSKKYGGSCNSGWYNIEYNGNKGYVCSGYIAYGNPANEVDQYLRPWTTPKKAIVGGAIYIANSYISKGQFTSYLKRFNVNPNSSYTKYNHQYMENLAAPSSEASSSYNSYKENGILNMALEFSIPIYNNMPDYTALPGKNADTSCQVNIDQNFENYLNSQEFPESYKCKLRALHISHPNWIFKSMKTNLDFNASVAAEDGVSSIQGNESYYRQPKEQTEPGWYRANDETIKYYMDPRNFLNENKILMFEDLEYKDYYNEEMIKNILSGTFMDGIEPISNQTYASIFVEAGKEAKMSSVYLASLSKQEKGSKMSNTTNGAEFTYEGITYKGLYNFFNIGANSSASNPALAGLVWATGGFDITYIVSSLTNSVNNNIQQNDEQNIINKMAVKKNGEYITDLSIGSTVSELKNKLSGYTVTSSIGDNDIVRTGATISVSDGANTYQYTMVVPGDVDGDGKIEATDYVKIKNNIMEKSGSGLNTAQSMAADVDGNGQIGATDYVKIKNNIMNR